MSTTDEISVKQASAATLIDALADQFKRSLDNELTERYLVMHPTWVRTWFKLCGGLTRRHARARSARGRKRALLHSWRPILNTGRPRIVIQREILPWASVIG